MTFWSDLMMPLVVKIDSLFIQSLSMSIYLNPPRFQQTNSNEKKGKKIERLQLNVNGTNKKYQVEHLVQTIYSRAHVLTD